MKNKIIRIGILIGVITILLIAKGYSQVTAIAPTTTIQAVTALKTGSYVYLVGKDSTYFNKDTALIVTVAAKVDTAAIQALKICPVCKVCPVCPAPVICPVCPPIPAQRTAIGISWDIILNKRTVTYDNGTTTVL